MSDAKETYNDGDRIKCPACGEVYRDLSEYELEDGGSVEIECEGERCGAKFDLYCWVSVSYRATVKQ